MSGAAFEGLAGSAGDAESYIPGEPSLEERLARETVESFFGEQTAVCSTLRSAAADPEFDHNAFLEAYILALGLWRPAESAERVEKFLSPMVQALYDAGRNSFRICLDGLVPFMVATGLHGTPERRLELSYTGSAFSFGTKSQFCILSLHGDAEDAGGGSDYCEFDLADSRAKVGYASTGCDYRIRSPDQIVIPVPQAFTLYRHHDRMPHVPRDCTFRVKDRGEFDAKDPIAALRKLAWEHVMLGLYGNSIIVEGDAHLSGGVER